MIYAGGTRNRLKLDKKRRFDKRIADAKFYSVGNYVWAFQEVVPSKGTKNLLTNWRGPFQITEVHRGGRFYQLSPGRAAEITRLSRPTMPHRTTGVSQPTCMMRTN